MNNAQNEALKIIVDTAIETIARVNNTTIETAKLAIQEGNVNACIQFQKLVNEGVNVANNI